MPVTTTTESIFESGSESLVCPVNCVGVMGAGLAKEFASRYNGLFADYKHACKLGNVKPGKIWIWAPRTWAERPLVICAPTKRHWKDPSIASDVSDALTVTAVYLNEAEIESCSIPLLGAGLGGLDKTWVVDKTLESFKNSPCRVIVHIR